MAKFYAIFTPSQNPETSGNYDHKYSINLTP